MADASTYIGVTPRTVIATNVALARGVRVTKNSSGFVAVQDATARGDFVTLIAIDASKPGQAVSAGAGGKVPALASEATVVGDPAYSAAAGKFSKTAANAVLMGRWSQAASGDGVLGEVELLEVL